MKKLNRFIIFVVVTILSLSVQFSCKNKNSVPLIQNYKLFKNAKYSFQYPSDWILTENGTNVTVTGPQVDSYFVNFKVDYNEQINMSLDEFVKIVEEQNNIVGLPAYVDKGKINVDLPADKAVQRTFTTNVNTTFSTEPIMLLVTLTYIVQEQTIGYVLTTEVPNRAYQKYSEVFANIKGSFRYQSKIKK